MKKFFLLALVCLFFALICGCERSGEIDKNPEKTIVTGKMINRDVYPDYKTVTVTVQDFRWSQNYWEQGIALLIPSKMTEPFV